MPKTKENKGKILFVEDDEFIAELYRQKLVLEGYEPLMARTMISAVLALKEQIPNAIILDIVLPDSDCWNVLKFVKKHSQYKNIPIIIFTNYTQASNIEKARRFNADVFIVKSHTTPAEVVQLLKDLIAGKRKSQPMLII